MLRIAIKRPSGLQMTAIRALSSTDHPPLVHVPSMPVFGSVISAYSGLPPVDFTRMIEVWRKIHQQYGPFYSIGLPSVGVGWLQRVYILRDPNEMLKVLKQEGTYPAGLIQTEWPLIAWIEKKGYESVGFFGQGADWKRLRSIMQKDMLNPPSAREYLPAILKGAAKASPKAAAFAAEHNLNRYLNFCAMDMFTQVLGILDMSEEDYTNFCRAAVDGLGQVFKLTREPLPVVAHKLGVETAPVRECHANLDTVDEIAMRYLSQFLHRIEDGKSLTAEEKNSYFYKLLERQQGSDVSRREIMELCVVTMLAAVDTTAGLTGWCLVQLALHPQVQDHLYQQLQAAIDKEGALTAGIFERGDVPLLSAIIRETHRCTPTAPVDILKKVTAPTQVHGITIDAGTPFLFDTLTVQMDPDIVEEPTAFKPERWLKEAVQARKDTPAAIIDHPFYSGPFSQGARRCPGSRVAHLEVQAILAQLVLDWKIEGPKNLHWSEVLGNMETVFVPQFPEMRFIPRK